MLCLCSSFLITSQYETSYRDRPHRLSLCIGFALCVAFQFLQHELSCAVERAVR